jgi:hypothetical protein
MIQHQGREASALEGQDFLEGLMAVRAQEARWVQEENDEPFYKRGRY